MGKLKDATINARIRESAIVEFKWPIKVYRQPNAVILMTIIDDAWDFNQSIYMGPSMHFNMGNITYWCPIDLRKSKTSMEYMTKYFDDVGGRIVSANGPISQG